MAQDNTNPYVPRVPTTQREKDIAEIADRKEVAAMVQRDKAALAQNPNPGSLIPIVVKDWENKKIALHKDWYRGLNTQNKKK